MTDLLTWLSNVFSALLEPETSLNQLLAMLDEQIPDRLVTDRGNLDELGETVSDLSDGQGLEERKVEESVEGGVVCSKPAVSAISSDHHNIGSLEDSPVLKLSVVDSDLDTDTGVDQTDQCGRDSDKVGCSSVRSTSVTRDIGDETTTDNERRLSSDGTERVHRIDDLEHSLPHQRCT